MPELKKLLNAQPLAVLATASENRPYTSLVAFVASEDLKNLFFLTGRSTRKFSNLENNPKVAMLIDDRSNRDSDFKQAAAVTALGRASEVNKQDKDSLLERYIDKHPALKDFASSPGSVLVKVEVEQYYMVTHFQEVTTIEIER